MTDSSITGNISRAPSTPSCRTYTVVSLHSLGCVVIVEEVILTTIAISNSTYLYLNILDLVARVRGIGRAPTTSPIDLMRTLPVESLLPQTCGPVCCAIRSIATCWRQQATLMVAIPTGQKNTHT